MSSGSPGPAPTNTTRPLDTEPLPETRAGLGCPSRRHEASEYPVEGLPPALGVERHAGIAQRAADARDDLRERRDVPRQERVRLLADEPGHGGVGAAGG